MANNKDWLPGQLEMARKWDTHITTAKASQWKIPQATMDSFHDIVNAAQDALTEAITHDRTEAINAEIRVKFGLMVDAMRDMKRRYFFMPPLTEMDWVAIRRR